MPHQNTSPGGTFIWTAGNVYTGGRDEFDQRQSSARSAGTHQLVTRAWDTSGAYGTVTSRSPSSAMAEAAAVVAATACLPLRATPSGSTTFKTAATGVGATIRAALAAAAAAATGWRSTRLAVAHGSSSEFFNSGVWANALWWQKVGAHNSAHNFLWDFWIYVDEQLAALRARRWNSMPSNLSAATTT